LQIGKFSLATNKYAADAYFLRCLECIDLPQRVICQQCGHVLYDGAELRPPDEILHEHNGKCPKCGKKLALIPIDVEVRPTK